jgi:hypothetical protein
MNAGPLNGRRVFIFQQRGWARNIGHGLAKVLQNDGAELAAFTMKKSTDIFVRNQSEVKYQFIISDDAIQEDPVSFLNGAEHSLDTICDDLELDSVWPPTYSMRTFMRSYDDAFYYGNRQNVPDEKIVLHIKAIYEMCLRVLNDFKPDAIIVPIFGGLPHIFLNIMARQRNIPMIGITDTKISGIYCFTHSYVDDIGPFVDRIDQLNSGTTESENQNKAEEYVARNRELLTVPSALSQFNKTSRRSPYRELRRLAGELKRGHNNPDFVKGFGSSIDARTKPIIVRDFFRRKRFERAVDRMDYASLENAREFAYFPLQSEPEVSIDVYAPRFNNQIETARQIAMSLPGELTLVVKDHPVMRGYRSPSYLNKLARTPNVTLVDGRLSSNEILRRAKFVIASTGTVLMEAAMLRVPTIQLGDLSPTRRLPNVTRHTDLSTLSKILREISTLDMNSPEYERRLVNYVAAAHDSGFTTDHNQAWQEARADELPKIYKLFYDELKRCMSLSNSPAEAAN